MQQRARRPGYAVVGLTPSFCTRRSSAFGGTSNFAEYPRRFAWIWRLVVHKGRSAAGRIRPLRTRTGRMVLELGVTVIGSNFDADDARPAVSSRRERQRHSWKCSPDTSIRAPRRIAAPTGRAPPRRTVYRHRLSRPEASVLVREQRATQASHCRGSRSACLPQTRIAPGRFGPPRRHDLWVQWRDFLMSGRAVIGSESGSSALDRARRDAGGASASFSPEPPVAHLRAGRCTNACQAGTHTRPSPSALVTSKLSLRRTAQSCACRGLQRRARA